MGFAYLWIMPVFCVIVPITFIITYLIAVSNGHVATIFPYISDTGALPPESCIFAQLLNIGALFGCVTVYLRHRQICEVRHAFYETLRMAWISKLSCVLLWTGYAACMGISLVANFQEENLSIVHYVGALTAFLFGLLYGFGQTVLSYVVDKFIISPCMAHTRLILVMFSTLFFGLMFSHNMISHNGLLVHESGNRLPLVNKKVNGTDQDYNWYLISAFSEWGFALTSTLFFVTFAAEFRKIVLHPPRILLHANGRYPGRFRNLGKPRDLADDGSTAPVQRDRPRPQAAFRYPEIRLPRAKYAAVPPSSNADPNPDPYPDPNSDPYPDPDPRPNHKATTGYPYYGTAPAASASRRNRDGGIGVTATRFRPPPDRGARNYRSFDRTHRCTRSDPCGPTGPTTSTVRRPRTKRP